MLLEEHLSVVITKKDIKSGVITIFSRVLFAINLYVHNNQDYSIQNAIVLDKSSKYSEQSSKPFQSVLNC